MSLYRAVDSQGNTLVFQLRGTHDAEAAKRFFLERTRCLPYHCSSRDHRCQKRGVSKSVI